jgi:hypothetical protein
MNTGIFTNNVYTILGICINKRILGIIIKTNYKYVYKKFQFVNLPLYHLITDSKPQFYKKNQNKPII